MMEARRLLMPDVGEGGDDEHDEAEESSGMEQTVARGGPWRCRWRATEMFGVASRGDAHSQRARFAC